MKLVDLNVDCLLRIFKLCSEQDLFNLCRANKYLNDVIEENIFYTRTLDLLMCGHRNSPHIQQRTFGPITYADRLSIGRNWAKGCYREYEYYRHSQLFATKMHLDRDWLYVSYKGYLRQYARSHTEPLQHRFQREISTTNKSDIAHFKKKQNTIFAGRVYGSCYIYEDGYATEQQLHTGKEYMLSVDFARDLYVTSTDHRARLWRRSNELGLTHLDKVHQWDHAYKALAFNEDGDRLFGGLYTDVYRRALREIDLETGIEQFLNSRTISIYDVKLKDDNVIFTANFDTTFRMFDRRTNNDELVWDDAFDSSYYCLDYDGLYAVLCGAKYHGRVNMFDIRMRGKHRQLFFPTCKRRGYSSPVYSIACDSRYLFIALDHSVRVLDFKVDCAPSRDYFNVFSERRSRFPGDSCLC